jgi:hypothetical protein
VTYELLPFYSFDSGAFINGRRQIFMPKTFGAIWTRIEGMIATGQVRAVDEVKREVCRKDDDTARWAKAQHGLFVPLAQDIQLATKKVLAEHPRLLGLGRFRNGADPFVIALAMTRGGTVVTQEGHGKNLNNPHIPDVCEAMAVPWKTLPEFVDEQGWTITVG